MALVATSFPLATAPVAAVDPLPAGVPADAHLAPRLADALAELARGRMAAGTPVTILAMERDIDNAYAAAIARAAARDVPAPRTHAIPVEPHAALELLADFDEAVSVRLHALLVCALAATPFVPIGYDTKVAGTATRLGLGGRAVPLADVSAGLVDRRSREVATDAVQATVEKAVAGLRAEASVVARIMAASIDE